MTETARQTHMTPAQAQCLLCYLGYYSGQIDGQWGPLSQSACTAFQRNAGITADGLAGPETSQALLTALTQPPVTAADSFWSRIRYWSRKEFRCRCGQYHSPYCDGFPAEPDQTLVELADDIRHLFGRPGHASSGIRCRQHNLDTGGVQNSAHLTGKALDFCIEGVSGEALRTYAAADPRCRYAYVISGGYVHIDVA